MKERSKVNEKVKVKGKVKGKAKGKANEKAKGNEKVKGKAMVRADVRAKVKAQAKVKGDAKGHCFVVHSDAPMLSTLVERVNDAYRRAAMEAYLEGSVHAALCWAEAFITPCIKGTQALTQGIVDTRLGICNGVETFCDLLCATPYVTYSACALSEDFDEADEPHPIDKAVDAATFARLERLPMAKLRAKLVADYFLDENTYRQEHAQDGAQQRAYREAVCGRFRAGARLAKRLGRETCALHWLEALRLITPSDAPWEEGLSREAAARAYQLAEMAHGELWVACAYRALGTKRER